MTNLNLNEYFTAEELASDRDLYVEIERKSIGDGSVILSVEVDNSDENGNPIGKFVVFDTESCEMETTCYLDEAEDLFDQMCDQAREAVEEAYENYRDTMSIMRDSYRW